ncbi:MAG TPA: LpqB family beta-propeller domain-containing protein [Candidatus Acidoferrales bacterium]|nr:LpqB family beta-propeller domain-containing protein [Candidatus Acidoferrales bacterium]
MLSPGKQLGPYEIVSLLGAGGMGEVYRARDGRLGRTVALKVLAAEVAGDPGRRSRFEQEARAASALNHPNILTVFDFGSQDGLTYIVTELIEGESLREMLRRGPIPQNRAIDIASQVADALAAAHASGIVHRDLKPENIMITGPASGYAGRAKILDFGLAKQVTPPGGDSTAALTRTSPGAVLGTAAYMSPEQVSMAAVDHRSDIFSFGLVLHECLTGRQTFERATAVETMTAILREDPPELPETAPPGLRQIVAHCLEKEPDRRFHSARDLAFALRTLSSSTTSSSTTRASGAGPTVAVPRPRRWARPIVAGSVAMIMVGLVMTRITRLEPIDLTAYRFTPFANDHEPETDGAWAPDGKSIAYLKTVDGIPELMVRALDSPTPIQLTRTHTRASQPFWAPDSTVIYYTTHAGKGELWGISPAGRKPARILEDLRTAAISPDGKSLAIWRVTESGNQSGNQPGNQSGNQVRGSVWISSPPGATPKPYQPTPFETPLDGVGNSLHFSPDGSWLLLIANGVDAQIWLLPFPAGRGQPRRLFAGVAFGGVPRASWLPDSRHAVLSFAPWVNNQPALSLADLKSEKLRKLTASTAGESDPSVSPDGKRVVFTSISDDYDLMELPLDGGGQRTLLANSRDMYSPSWSPAGDQLVYATDRTGGGEIWIHNTKAGLDRPVVTAADFPAGTATTLAHPVFSPDGNRFAFVRYSTNEPATIWIEPTVGGAPIRMSPEYMVAPAWSPDGNSIAGLMHREHPWQPAIVEVGANMTPHVIAGAPTCLMPLEWSPTGEWIACEARSGIELFSPDGSKHRTLPKLNSTAMAFSRDGGTIYAAGRENGRTFLKSIDLAGGAVRTIADYASDAVISGGATYQARLSLAPDGKSLATSAVVTRADLWLLEGYPLPRPWWHFW